VADLIKIIIIFGTYGIQLIASTSTIHNEVYMKLWKNLKFEMGIYVELCVYNA
jgi:hypothetical protein